MERFFFINSNILSKYKEIEHFVTPGYLSADKNHNFNLSIKTGGDKERGYKNRDLLAKELKIESDKLVFPDQCHTGNVGIVTKHNYKNNFKETDALITNEKGICLGILAADCVPVLIYEPIKKVIAAVHAGWRGSYKKITGKTVKRMIDKFRCNPEKMIAFIGPSICSSCYDVGEEVAQKFKNGYYPEEIIVKKENKMFLDLWLINFIQLEKAGLDIKNIEISGVCTYENTNVLFSARKEGMDTGRFSTGILIN